MDAKISHMSEIVKAELVEDHEVDQSDPRNIINLVPSWLKLAIKALPPDYLEMGEEELRQLVYQNKQTKSTATKLRLAFWEEYDRCQNQGDSVMFLKNILIGNSTMIGFQKLIDRQPEFLAWLLTPPAVYMMKMKEILNLGHERMLEILSATTDLGNGIMDSRLAKVQHAIYETMLDRVHGAVVQNQRTMNVNLNAKADEVTQRQANVAALTDMDEIQRRLQAAQEKSRQLASPPQMQQDVQKLVAPRVTEK